MGQARSLIVLVVCALSFAAPAALCLGLAKAPCPSMIDLGAATLAASLWLILLVLVNWWEFAGLWWRWVWPLVLLAIAAERARAVVSLAPAWGPATVVAAILAAAAVWPLAFALAARRPPTDAIDLSFPLRGGRFLVTDGGDGAKSFLVNYHYGFGKHRSSGVSDSMRYAMDVVEVGRGGRSAHGFFPPRNEAFRIWDRPLHAPCAGRIAHVVVDTADNTPFGDHRPYGVGNHVVIFREPDIYVVLGHMRCGSITVAKGDRVHPGDAIGRVGNSGWTERPHLHLQAMRSLEGDWWHGAPLPIRFGGRFLIRNQVLRA